MKVSPAVIALGLGALFMAGSKSAKASSGSGSSGEGIFFDEDDDEDYEPTGQPEEEEIDDPFFEPQGPSTLPEPPSSLDPNLWDVERIMPGQGTPPDPMIVGFPDEPEVAEALAELDQFLMDHNLYGFTDAEEITRMPKAPGQPVAVPPYELWENIIVPLWIWKTIREEMGVPMALRGYRPSDYNKAVNGSDRSTHQWFAALDIRITGDDNTAANRKELALKAAEFYNDVGSEYKLGFGAYGAPVPGNIHIDAGFKKRKWEDASHYTSQV